MSRTSTPRSLGHMSPISPVPCHLCRKRFLLPMYPVCTFFPLSLLFSTSLFPQTNLTLNQTVTELLTAPSLPRPRHPPILNLIG